MVPSNVTSVVWSVMATRRLSYITRIAEYLSHASSLDDSATSCLCPGKTNHCNESDLCSSHCYTCFDDSVALSLPVSAGREGVLTLCSALYSGVDAE